MNRERLEQIKQIKQDTKVKYKGKAKMTQKEINELVLLIAKIMNIVEDEQ